MRTTLKDLSEKTGLALSTISMALNDHPMINVETKKMVKKFATDLNYRPNPAARALVQKKTSLIGLVLQDVLSSFYPEIIQGVEDVAMTSSFSTILCCANENPAIEVMRLESLLDKGVDGVILEPHEEGLDHEILAQFKRMKIPVVTILRRYHGFDFPGVEVDNELGAFKATQYLINQGHKIIGFLAGPSYSQEGSARLLGYRKALSKAGIEFNKDWVIEGSYSLESGKEGVSQLLDRFPQASSLFATSDLIAMGALYVLQQRNISVPNQFKIVGFDGLDFGQMLEPKLTTIAQPRNEIGTKAANLLLRLIEDKPVESILLQPELLIGQSA